MSQFSSHVSTPTPIARAAPLPAGPHTDLGLDRTGNAGSTEPIDSLSRLPSHQNDKGCTRSTDATNECVVTPPLVPDTSTGEPLPTTPHTATAPTAVGNSGTVTRRCAVPPNAS